MTIIFKAIKALFSCKEFILFPNNVDIFPIHLRQLCIHNPRDPLNKIIDMIFNIKDPAKVKSVLLGIRDILKNKHPSTLEEFKDCLAESINDRDSTLYKALNDWRFLPITLGGAVSLFSITKTRSLQEAQAILEKCKSDPEWKYVTHN